MIGHVAAAALVEMALRAALENGFAAAVAVVDAAGALRAFGRADGAAAFTAEVAVAKARTAAASGMPTHIWNAIVADPASAPLAQMPGMMPVAGGYPLNAEGSTVGGIGVSGGPAEHDRAAAAAALATCGFPVE